MSKSDLHAALSLKPGCTDAEVKQAYRDLVQVWHPDRFMHDPRLRAVAEEKLKEITQAYEELLSFVEKEPERRRAAAEDLEELRSTIRKASATRACRLRWAKRAAVVFVASLCAVALLLSVTLYSRLGAAARLVNSVLQQALRASQLRQPEWIISSLGRGYDAPGSPGDLTI